jgi:surface antigen
MVGSLLRLAAAALFAASLAGCASSPPETRLSDSGDRPSYGATIQTPDQPNQCVPYARERSGIALHGDANTWWAQAEGRYQRNASPLLGAVMVLTGYSPDGRNHLAVVSSLVSEREIRVDHANWLNDGNIYVDDPVVDVSANNDWTQVRVWNARTRAWGVRVYLVEGFIGPGPAGDPDKVALY